MVLYPSGTLPSLSQRGLILEVTELMASTNFIQIGSLGLVVVPHCEVACSI